MSLLMIVNRCILVLTLSSALAVPVLGQVPAGAAGGNGDMFVAASGTQVSLEVRKNRSLRDVVLTLCAAQNVECSGTQLLPSENVSPILIVGSQRAVVNQLLDGADVNYDYSPVTPEARAKLVITGRVNPGVPALQPATSASSSGGSSPQTSAPALDASAALAPASSGEWDADQSTAIDALPAGSGVATSDTPATEQLLHQMEFMFKGSSTVDSDQQRYQPFPDQYGNRIPVNATSVQYQPFPDGNGNPIPVKPGGSGWPFPVQIPPPSDSSSH